MLLEIPENIMGKTLSIFYSGLLVIITNIIKAEHQYYSMFITLTITETQTARLLKNSSSSCRYGVHI